MTVAPSEYPLVPLLLVISKSLMRCFHTWKKQLREEHWDMHWSCSSRIVEHWLSWELPLEEDRFGGRFKFEKLVDACTHNRQPAIFSSNLFETEMHSIYRRAAGGFFDAFKPILQQNTRSTPLVQITRAQMTTTQAAAAATTSDSPVLVAVGQMTSIGDTQHNFETCSKLAKVMPRLTVLKLKMHCRSSYTSTF